MPLCHWCLHRLPCKGQSLVEFALVSPLLVALVIGIFELGILFSLYIGLTNTVREVARVGAIYRYPGPSPQTVSLNNPTQAQLITAATPLDAGRFIAMTEALTATLHPIIQPAKLGSLEVRYPEPLQVVNLARSGQTISLTLTYTHTLLFGMLGDRNVVLHAQSSARIEPGGN